MIRRIITLLTLLVVISSCKAQGNNNIKQNKTLERTTERFDTSTYYMERQGHDYQFEHYLRGKVRQFGGDNGSDFVEYARKEKSLFGTYKEYHNKTRTLKKVGQYYYNEFNIGIWKVYDENGYLIETIDKDAPYKNYPWEKVEKFVKEELKLVQHYLLGQVDGVAKYHQEWADDLKAQHPDLSSEEEAQEVVRVSVGNIFARVLEDAGVYKRTEEGQAAFRRFVTSLGKSKS